LKIDLVEKLEVVAANEIRRGVRDGHVRHFGLCHSMTMLLPELDTVVSMKVRDA
jgi:hypothetical protein